MAKIGIDVGHGVNTFPPNKGVFRNGIGYAEHTFNSNVAIALKKSLEDAGHKIYMAQQPMKAEVGLNARTRYYNGLDLDLIVSIHANAGVAAAKGLCAFYWEGSKNGKKLADAYAKALKETNYNVYSGGTFPSKLNHWSNFAMLRDTVAPTILTENGFMTNAAEHLLLFRSPEFIKDVAEIHAKAIATYLGVKYESNIKEPTIIIEAPKTIVKGISTPEPNNKPTSQGQSDKIKLIQTFLNDVYYADVDIDGYDGPKTRKALLKGLQKELNVQFKAGLSVDGIWGTNTEKAIVTVKNGAKGNITKLLQAALILEGYNTNGFDIYFGDGTEKAVRALQKANDLKADGIAGKATFKQLFK